MNSSTSLELIATALAAAQAEMKNPTFDSVNPYFKSKYASLAAVRDTVIPVLAKHGIAVFQSATPAEHGIAVTTRLLHSSGQWLETDPFMVPVTKDDAQGVCSASTYARRYSLQFAAMVVGDGDDDGNAAAAKPSRRASSASPSGKAELESFPPAASPGASQKPSPATLSMTAPFNALSMANSVSELKVIWDDLKLKKGGFSEADWLALSNKKDDRKRELGVKELEAAMAGPVLGPDGKPVEIK